MPKPPLQTEISFMSTKISLFPGIYLILVSMNIFIMLKAVSRFPHWKNKENLAPFSMVYTWFTPSLPQTIISQGDLEETFQKISRI